MQLDWGVVVAVCIPALAPVRSSSRPRLEPGRRAWATGSRRGTPSPRVWVRLGTWFAAMVVVGCHTDTRGLERHEPASAGQGSGGGAGASSAAGAGGGAGDESGAGDALATPSGPVTLSVVHGLSDGGRLFTCLRNTSTGQELPAGGAELQAGLEFGKNAPLSVDWDVAVESAAVELFAARDGALSALGLGSQPGCADLRRLAGSARAATSPPSPVVALDAGTRDSGVLDSDASSNPVEPPPNGLVQLEPVAVAAGSLHAGGHYALVATGCAATVSEVANEAGCGALDVLTGVRASELLVEFATGTLDDPAYIGLQFLNASRALGRADMLLQGQDPNQPPRALANQVPFGALRPARVTAVEVPLALQLQAGGGAGSTFLESWRDALAASGLDGAPLNHDYLLLFVGPNPSLDPTTLLAAGLAPPGLVLLPAD